MLVTFDYWLSYGKGDSGEGYIEMEITEEEYERLRKAFIKFGEEFDECEMVADIYDRVWDLANEDATSTLVAEGLLEEGTKASERYPIGVCYPFSYDDFDDDEFEDD